MQLCKTGHDKFVNQLKTIDCNMTKVLKQFKKYVLLILKLKLFDKELLKKLHVHHQF